MGLQIIGEVPKEPCIYKITSPKNRIYIGKSVNLKRRINNYHCLCIKGQKAIYNSLLSHGVESHTIEVIELTSLELIDERENYWVEFYKSNKVKYKKYNGLNLADGGKGGEGQLYNKKRRDEISKRLTGIKRSEETKAKISKSNKGKKRTPEQCKKFSEIQLARGAKMSEENKIKLIKSLKNRVVSEETKKKLSASKMGNTYGKGHKLSLETKKRIGEKNAIALKGKKLSEETRKKISEGNKGKKQSTETKIKISEANRGKIMSQEQKNKISQTKKGVKFSVETKLKMSKKVLNIKTNEIYLSVKLASEAFEVNSNTLKTNLRINNIRRFPLIYLENKDDLENIIIKSKIDGRKGRKWIR